MKSPDKIEISPIKMVIVVMLLTILPIIKTQAQWQNGTDIYNTNSGNVGIGTSTPSYNLDVSGTWALRQNGYFFNSIAYSYESSTNQYLHFKTTQGKGYLGMESSNSLILQSNGGFVGIGTANPSNKLEVRGTIRAMEVKVDVNIPADYVFDENYNLKSLGEVEAFVKANHHLPGLPSAEKIKEAGGMLEK